MRLRLLLIVIENKEYVQDILMCVGALDNNTYFVFIKLFNIS